MRASRASHQRVSPTTWCIGAVLYLVLCYTTYSYRMAHPFGDAPATPKYSAQHRRIATPEPTTEASQRRVDPKEAELEMRERIHAGQDDDEGAVKPDGGAGLHIGNLLSKEHMEGNVTVVLMSWPGSKRLHLTEKIANNVRTWKFVKEVLLVWNDPGEPPAQIKALAAETHFNLAPFRILPQAKNRVDNRWRIGSEITTDAVLNMDDDVDLSQDGARCMLSVWRSAPTRLVGIDVRSHFRHPSGSGPHGPFGYAARDTTSGTKAYSIMLPRSLITHKQNMIAYDKRIVANKGFHDIVDELLCDDIAFNCVASDVAGAGPIYVKAPYKAFPESHSGGAMFKKPGMKAKRQQCVNRLAANFGQMPLVAHSWHVLCTVDG